MFPGPVFQIELMTTARRLRYYVLRFVYGAVLLFLIWVNDPFGPGNGRYSANRELAHNELSRLGQTLFMTFAVTQAVAVLLITPAMIAGVIADERQRKTLHYLMCSRLSGVEIVLGKLAARLLHVGVYLLLGLPIVVMLSFFGGVDPNDVVLFFVCCASTAFFLGAVSVTVSAYSRRPREAVSSVYSLELAWLIGPLLVKWVMPEMGEFWKVAYEVVEPVNRGVGMSNPLFIVTEGLGPLTRASGLHDYFYRMAAIQVVAGCVFAGWTVFRLRAIYRKGDESSGRLGRFLKRKSLRLLPRPACGDDAMVWKECFVARSRPLTKLLGGLTVLVAVGLLTWGTYTFAEPAFRELADHGLSRGGPSAARGELNGWLRFVLTLASSVLLLWTASASSGGLTSEREEDTWVSLLASPLTAGEIVRGKVVGVIWGVRWLLALWAAYALTGLFLGAIHPVGLFLTLTASVAYVGFGCALGTYLSSVLKSSSRSLIATIAILIVLNGGYLIATIPLRSESSFRFVGVTMFVEAISLWSYSDFETVLQTSPGGDYWNLAEMTITSIVSVFLYGVAALSLFYATVARFDDNNDRPRTGYFARTARARGGPEVVLTAVDPAGPAAGSDGPSA